jgi:DNA mismatch repair ATPase MutL
MEDKENSNKEKERNEEEEEEEEEKKIGKSRKKSKSKGKKPKIYPKSKKKQKKEEDDDNDEPAKEEEEEKEGEKEEEEEAEGEDKGTELMYNDVEDYLKQMRNEETANFWRGYIYKGKNNCCKPKKWNWGHRQNWLFVHCGEYYYNDPQTNQDFKQIEKLSHLAYFTLTYYYDQNKNKKGQPIYVTILSLYFAKQIVLHKRYLKFWVLFDKTDWRGIRDIVCGNFANKMIREYDIKIVNENLIPGGKDELLNDLNFRTNEINGLRFNEI